MVLERRRGTYHKVLGGEVILCLMISAITAPRSIFFLPKILGFLDDMNSGGLLASIF